MRFAQVQRFILAKKMFWVRGTLTIGSWLVCVRRVMVHAGGNLAR